MKPGKTKRQRAPRQRQLEFPQHGGARKGAGRKPKGSVAGASHTARASTPARHPLLVTQRLCAGLPSLRKAGEREVILDAIADASERDGFRIVHFSIQTNHLHYLCEARDAQCLSRGMKGLGVSLARRLNRLWRRTGRVFAERFHARALATPSEVRNALVYVLNNARKHGVLGAGVDAFSSGPWFDGWRLDESPQQRRVRDRCQLARASPTATAHTWLLRIGWRSRGLIDTSAVPGGRTARATNALAAPIDRGLSDAARQSRAMCADSNQPRDRSRLDPSPVHAAAFPCVRG
jgi:REP element-mobilizing transposase RayT